MAIYVNEDLSCTYCAAIRGSAVDNCAMYYRPSIPKMELITNKQLFQSRVQGPRQLYGDSSILHEKLDGSIFMGPSNKALVYSNPRGLVNQGTTYGSLASTPLLDGTKIVPGLSNHCILYRNFFSLSSYTVLSETDSFYVDSDVYNYQPGSKGKWPVNVMFSIIRRHGYVASNPSIPYDEGQVRVTILYVTENTYYPWYGDPVGRNFDEYSLGLQDSSKVVLENTDLGLIDLLRSKVRQIVSSLSIVNQTTPLHPWYTQQMVTIGLRTSSLKPVRELFRAARLQYLAEVSEPRDSRDWGKLCLIAIKDCKYCDANLVAFLSDLPKFADELKQLLVVLKNPKSIKNWAGLFLSYKYGTRLTISDSEDILKGIGRKLSVWTKSYSAVRSRSREIFPTSQGSGLRNLNYKIYYNPYDSKLLKIIKTLIDWDAWIDMGNAWDMIPLSFVIDWVVNIGDLLEDFDAINYIFYLTVNQVIATTKDSMPVSLLAQGLGIYAPDAMYTRYNRELRQSLSLPVPSLGFEPIDSKHFPELGAIVVQIFKKK